MNRLRGGIPVPEYRRTTRASDPALRNYVPALAQQTENANQTVNKVSLLLNRAGSSRFNPILAGLGMHVEFKLGDIDRLIAVYVYQTRPEFGQDMIDQVSSLGGNIFGLEWLVGAGNVVAGSPTIGAVQNFFRVKSRAGAGERQMWVKSYDKDIVVVDDQNCLDDALAQVEIVKTRIAESQAWIDCNIGFMPSWLDEFQVGHNRNVDDVSLGNSKAYGGAAFVSFFQTGEDEGVGTEVFAETKSPIASQHKLQVENTVGLKHVTVRFRSKADSIYYVDIDILIRVIAAAEGDCTAPLGERCGESLLLADTALPADMPSISSVPGVQVVAGVEGEPVTRDLHYLAMHGNVAGASPKLRITRYQAIAVAEDVAGYIYEAISTLDYLALVAPADVPVGDPPYTGPVQMIVAFDKDEEKLAGVALYVVSVLDGDHVSPGIPFPGPSARDIAFFPVGETGGTDECFYG